MHMRASGLQRHSLQQLIAHRAAAAWPGLEIGFVLPGRFPCAGLGVASRKESQEFLSL